MPISRRQLLQRGAAAAALGMLPAGIVRGEQLWGSTRPASPFVPNDLAALADPSQVRELALTAVSAARDAGATYADVRLTRTVDQYFYTGSTSNPGGFLENQHVAVGVRAMFNGFWGFASSPFWRSNEMVILAKSAVEQAKANSGGTHRSVDLGTTPTVTGHWTTPIRIDPFSMPIEERIDAMSAWMEFADHYRRDVNHELTEMRFKRQERALATTDGSYVTQLIYETTGEFPISVNSFDTQQRSVTVSATGLGAAGRGWELFLDAKIPNQIPALVAQADERNAAPIRPAQVGRYDIVYDAQTVAALINATIGPATQLDRALGADANFGGTSFLNNPLTMLGRSRVGSQLLTVTGDRSAPGGLATVQWDDEGVAPQSFTLIQNGILVDYQTTREQAAWLAPWYQQRNMPIRSHACAASDTAMNIPMQHIPNLILNPGATAASFDDLVADTRRGLAVIGGAARVDFQGRSGTGSGAVVREILDGKLGAVLTNATYFFDALQLWRRLTEIGGPESVEMTPFQSFRGPPFQFTTHSVLAPPAKLSNVALMDMTRRE